MATFYATGYAARQPEAVHAGLNCATFVISLSVSSTPAATDTIIIGKIPHGAIPVDAVFYPGAQLAANGCLALGTSASTQLFFATSTTFSSGITSARSNRKLGPRLQVSLSDDAMPRFENVVMTTQTGVSVSDVGTLVVFYKMPGQATGA
jgi:hypothetical protein